jgi:hypothetical protein
MPELPDLIYVKTEEDGDHTFLIACKDPRDHIDTKSDGEEGVEVGVYKFQHTAKIRTRFEIEPLP